VEKNRIGLSYLVGSSIYISVVDSLLIEEKRYPGYREDYQMEHAIE